MAVTVIPMATQKVSVTLDEEAIARARRMVGPRGLSAYVDSALQEKLVRDEQRQTLLEWFDELDAADPPSDIEVKRAERRAAQLMAKISQ